MPVRKFTLLFNRRLILVKALGHDKAQNIIDQITAAYESSGGPPPGGFGFGPQHLMAPPPPFLQQQGPGGRT
jgi:U1 small nuclear ribonucleoprotein C